MFVTCFFSKWIKEVERRAQGGMSWLCGLRILGSFNHICKENAKMQSLLNVAFAVFFQEGVCIIFKRCSCAPGA